MSEPQSGNQKIIGPVSDKDGDTEIVGTFIKIRNSLMHCAARYLSKKRDAEDIVQEACMKVLEAQRQRPIQSPKAYLFRTTKNLALKEIAKSANRLTDALGDLPPETVIQESLSLEEELEAREKFDLFCRAVRGLPVKCQRVFVLRKVYGFTPTEIAKHLGISIKTVEAHLANGIVRCTEFMDNAERQELSEPKQSEKRKQK